MTSSIIRTATVAVAAATTLLLAGCFGPAPAPVDPGTEQTDPGTESGNGAAPATGETITGTGYSFQVPEGWGVPEGMNQPGLDSVAIDLNDTDGFSDNVNVIVSPAGELSVEQIEQLAAQEIEASGGTEVEFLDRITIDGSLSPHLTGVYSASGATYRIDQYYPTVPGQTYIVTFSFNDTLSQADRDAVAHSILASWKFE